MDLEWVQAFLAVADTGSFSAAADALFLSQPVISKQVQKLERQLGVSTSQGVQAITIRDLIRTALRMRPNRILVGECRGAETLDMLQAMNTGHDGSLSTGHANTARDMLSRLEMMIRMGIDLPITAMRSQIASGIDILVHLGRLRDGSRRVLSVTELVGISSDGEIVMNELYGRKRQPDGTEELVRTGGLKNRDKLYRAEHILSGE